MTNSKNAEKKQATLNKNDDWDEEAWQNWLGFWSLILQEDMKQNPHFYKKNGRRNYHKAKNSIRRAD